MRKKLTHADGLAVDFVLDHLNEVKHESTSTADTFVPARGLEPQRIESVEKILDLLEELPAAEPSPELLRRTMQRILRAPVSMPGDSTDESNDRRLFNHLPPLR